MASSPIGIPPLRHETPLTPGNRITPEAHQSLLKLYNAQPLIKVSTANGPVNVPVPLAKLNQGVEFVYVKTSADANAFTLTPSGDDTINFGTPVVSGTAQGSMVKIKSDGDSNWYVAS